MAVDSFEEVIFDICSSDSIVSNSDRRGGIRSTGDFSI
eukprot:CAMPEP_0196190408 /NCGR_PEP_ID=MMETSP0911-20130528/46270_1 /TAXON_ID=49265 /ORGANISM="Thalassiosira rotula, Strain GSO102" /LENGTH=37 /DNA_ID= /DNA_START= /DNA_END= /DNA_ORIENTATION=